MKGEETAQQRRTWWKRFFADPAHRWWGFCFAIALVKFLLLAVDPSPKLFLGDSLRYVSTAISGRAPADLSYIYGYVVQWCCNWATSFTPLLIVQLFLGVGTAITVAWICRAILLLSEWSSYLFGLLCCIDPLQLAWERYIMPETCSLLVYALVLQQSFVYVQRRRLANLLLIQILSVIAVAFRLIFLIPLQVMAAALPVIAFAIDTTRLSPVSSELSRRLQFLHTGAFWRHFAVSFVAMFFITLGHKAAGDLFSGSESTHRHGFGDYLLSAWAPAVAPQDAADPRLAEIISHGTEFGLADETLRSAQRHRPGHLIERWRRVEPDNRKSSEISRQTALSALRRNPSGVMRVAANTYYAFWRGPAMERLAKAELGRAKPSESQRKLLFERYHWRDQVDSEPMAGRLYRSYYVAAVPYYFAILLSPLLSIVLVVVASEKPYALLLLVHTSLVFCTIFLLSLGPTIRHLQPLSILLLLSAALGLKCLYPMLSEGSQNFQTDGRRPDEE